MLLIFLLFQLSSQSESFLSLATLGDSVSVGENTSEEFSWDLLSMEKILLTKPSLNPNIGEYSKTYRDKVEDSYTRTLLPPTRIWESLEEHQFNNVLDRLRKKTEIELKKKYMGDYLDIEEYSWPFLLGRSLEVPSKNILLLGEGGDKVSHSLPQAKRLLKHTKNILPNLIFIHFTGNDLCSINLEEDPQFFWGSYQKSLQETLDLFASQGKTVEKQKTKVFILGHFNISKLLTEKSVLEKQIFAFGRKRTCEEFRNFIPGEEDEVGKMKSEELKKLWRTFLPHLKNLPAPSALCFNLFRFSSQDKKYLENAKNIEKLSKGYQSAAIAAISQTEKKYQKELKMGGLSFHYLEIDQDMQLEGSDIANDCFHLSLKGQEKVASKIRTEIKKD